MLITDEQVAPLRAQLSRNPEEHRRLFAKLDQDSKNTGYAALVSAAFVVAARRRFNKKPEAEVIEFIGDVRSRSAGLADQVDPTLAERLIKSAFTGQPVDDVDGQLSWETQIVLMAAIVADEQLDDAGLDEFLAKARKMADAWLS